MHTLGYRDLVIVPLSHYKTAVLQPGDKLVMAGQGNARVVQAIREGEAITDKSQGVYFGIFARTGFGDDDFCEALMNTLTRKSVPEEDIIRFCSERTGTNEEMYQAIHYAKRKNAKLLFVTSAYHVEQVKRIAKSILREHDYTQWTNSKRLRFAAAPDVQVTWYDRLLSIM